MPDIEGNGHHGVEDNDVTPEAEETPVGGAVAAAVGQVPGFGADLLVPEGMTDCQARRYQDQQRKDLRRNQQRRRTLHKFKLKQQQKDK